MHWAATTRVRESLLAGNQCALTLGAFPEERLFGFSSRLDPATIEALYHPGSFLAKLEAFAIYNS